jgi:AcrR family transcriptional regulator
MTVHTRRNIVVKADTGIRQKGFNAFRFSDIAEDMAIRNAAIHYYFRSKASLGEAVIEDELRRIEAERAACEGLSGEVGLKRYVGLFIDHHRSGEVCLTGALAGEFHTFTAPMKEKIAKMQAGILGWMTGTLEKGRVEGSIRFDGAAADRALLLMGTLMAALLLARVQGPAIFTQSVNRMLADLGAGWTVEQIN